MIVSNTIAHQCRFIACVPAILKSLIRFVPVSCRAVLRYFIVLLALCFSSTASAQTICARVKLEIRQDLTMERQAFDAKMRITNELDNIPLENVQINVLFADEDGQPVLATSDTTNTAAKFFIRIDSMDGVEDISGNGVIPTNTTAEIHWLIIPAPGSAGTLASGVFYSVGATVSYTFGGESQELAVAPDFITVRALPSLSLDYFVTRDIFGDDAFTSEIEPPVPFSLGVRIKNNGAGAAPNLRIDSAQPEIIDNEQGLLIGFQIDRSTVNDQPAIPSLLIDFGDLPGFATTTGRWIMHTTLSGQFIEFGARYSHADALGGELTSLLQSIDTHDLIRDVRVDLPGRDAVLDFLALDGDVVRVYESSGLDTAVTNQSALTNVTDQGSANGSNFIQVEGPATAGFMYATVPDPYGGFKEVARVVRSDGKLISLDNVWFSRTRNGASWSYWLNVFDANTTGKYTIVLDDIDLGPQPPALQFIADRTVVETNQVSFIVEASDPNGDQPLLSAAPLPAGASYTDQGDGLGIFDWVPAVGQAGEYTIQFTASDGALSSSREATIVVNSVFNTDADDLLDEWELNYFGTLDRDGSGDFDGDGISDLQEFIDGTDPTLGTGPGQPQLLSPLHAAHVITTTPTLTVLNSSHRPETTLSYFFELYSDAQMTNLVSSAAGIAEGAFSTEWQVQEILLENTDYYWRVRAHDGSLYSLWSHGRFFVNQSNDVPGAIVVASPADGTNVDNLTPVLSVSNSTDAEGDVLTYRFEVATDPFLINLVASSEDLPPGGDAVTGKTNWSINTQLVNNSFYYWSVTVTGSDGDEIQSAVSSFFVDTSNGAPTAPVISSPVQGDNIAFNSLDLITSNAIDADSLGLVYHFELDTRNTFDSPSKIVSEPIAEGFGTTQFSVDSLVENTIYFWRVKASDSEAESPWAYSSFTVNTNNEAPLVPVVNNPGGDSWSGTWTPMLSVRTTSDPDGDIPKYRFEVYADEELTILESEVTSSNKNELILTPLENNVWHYWRVRSEDALGATSVWSDTYRFFVEDDGDDEPPVLSFYNIDASQLSSANAVQFQWSDVDPDSAAVISFYYDTDAAGGDGVLIEAEIAEDPDGDADQYTWDLFTVPPGTYWVYAVITDYYSSSTVYATESITVVEKQPPQVTQFQLVPNPVLVNTIVNVSATVDDSLTGGSVIEGVEFNIDGGSYQAMLPQDGALDSAFENVAYLTNGFATADIQLICIRATDDVGNTSVPQCDSLVVQNPETGSVKKSSGTVYSSAGADQLNPTAEGIAQYQVNAAYKGQATIPSGKMTFDFGAEITFVSTSMQWLIVSDEPRALLGGVGSLNQFTTCNYEVDLYDDSFLFEDAFGIRIFNCNGIEGLRYSLAPQPLVRVKM